VRAPVDRVLDLADEDSARAFLEPDGLAGSVEWLPLPCRVVRLAPAPSEGEGDPCAPAGVVARSAPNALVLAGPTLALRELASLWGGSSGKRLSGVLDRYDTTAHLLRFPDGSSWNLGRRTRVMGILNVTPDSFSDGGRFTDPTRALDRALEMAAEGADCVDVGGESTRPGAEPVDPEEEARRVIPTIAALRRSAPALRISIDTRRSVVARRALDAGADLINDVSALADPGMGPLAAERGCPVVLMHMRGEPATMQLDTGYADQVGDVLADLAAASHRARSHGVAGDRILIDPGFGFGKSGEGNEELLRQLATFRSLGYPILVGVSRKSFIGRLTGVDKVGERLAGSLAAAVVASLAGAQVIRAHDVPETREAMAIAATLRRSVGAVQGAGRD
jgi:dihydropteroate synthase